MLHTFLERMRACQSHKGGDVPDPPPPAKPPKPPAPSDAAENLRLQRMAKADRERRGFRSTIYTRGLLTPTDPNMTSILGG